MFALGVGSGCTAGFGALLAELYPTEVRGAAMGATYNLARAAQLRRPSWSGSRSRGTAWAAASAVPCAARAGDGELGVGPYPRRAASAALGPTPPARRSTLRMSEGLQ